MTTKEKHAYTAGFVDGEGYIGMVKRYDKTGKEPFYAVPIVKIANTDYEVLYLLKEEYGGYIGKERIDKKAKNSKPSRMWELKNRKLVKIFLEKIFPYLIIKKERAKIVLSFIEECGTWRQQYGVSEEKRIEYYWKMRELNRRGLATTE